MGRSEPPGLLLVHGWGLGPGLWHAVRRALPDWPCHALDLGFFGRPSGPVPVDRPWLAVGHSMGFLWLLHHLEQAPWRAACVGLVSVAGFSRFGRGEQFPHGVAPRVLARMRQRLAHDASVLGPDAAGFQVDGVWVQPLDGASRHPDVLHQPHVGALLRQHQPRV